MSGSLRIEDASSAQSEHASVTFMRGAVGTHIGLRYRANDEGELHHLHLAFHNDLMDDDSPQPGTFRVVSSVPLEDLTDVALIARLVAKRHVEGGLPYAFEAGASFDENGSLTLGKSLGLTCATFVLAIFDAAHVRLLDAATWKTRSAKRAEEDKKAQESLVNYLRRKDPAHSERVEAEIGCTRFRGEEVAAASGLAHRPVNFSTAEIAGAEVLRHLENS